MDTIPKNQILTCNNAVEYAAIGQYITELLPEYYPTHDCKKYFNTPNNIFCQITWNKGLREFKTIYIHINAEIILFFVPDRTTRTLSPDTNKYHESAIDNAYLQLADPGLLEKLEAFIAKYRDLYA